MCSRCLHLSSHSHAKGFKLAFLFITICLGHFFPALAFAAVFTGTTVTLSRTVALPLTAVDPVAFALLIVFLTFVGAYDARHGQPGQSRRHQ